MSPEEAQHVEAHVQQCAICEKALETMAGGTAAEDAGQDHAEATQTAQSDQVATPRKEIVGPYRLLQQIGEGGMGTVWLAEQKHPVRRRVALKLIRPGMDTDQVVARFEAERQALAMMNHPNIAKVLDVGTTDDDRPYFVMELVQGQPLTKYCDAEKLPLDQRLELFAQVCDAVQHAHQKGIIHRDVKPSNVLVSVENGTATPKVIDFGLAKAMQTEVRLTDRTLFTEFGQVVGTVTYMSPEQAGSSADIDTRTDIYSLGVLLYELLTGATPIEKDSINRLAYDQVLQIIREKEPPRPSSRITDSGEKASSISELRQTDPGSLRRTLGGELDWVVMKALEKDRARRYETATAFADDVRRYLSNDTVIARPPSAAYRNRKFVRRNRASVTAASLVMFSLIGGLLGTTIQWRRAVVAEAASSSLAKKESEQRELAEELAEENGRRLYISDMSSAQVAWDAGDVRRTIELLRRHIPTAESKDRRQFEWFYLAVLCDELADVPSLELSRSINKISFVETNPPRLLVADHAYDLYSDAAVRSYATKEWIATELIDVRQISYHRGKAYPPVAFSTDGQVVAYVSKAEWLGKDASEVFNRTRVLVLQDVTTGDPLDEKVIFRETGFPPFPHLHWQDPDAKLDARGVAISPNRQWLATAHRFQRLLLWRITQNKQLDFVRPLSIIDEPSSVAFSPDNSTLAIAGQDAVLLWSMPAHGEPRRLSRVGVVTCLAFNEDASLLACGTDAGRVYLWDLETRSLVKVMEVNTVVHSVAISPGNTNVLAYSGDDSIIRLWDIHADRLIRTLLGHSDTVCELTFSPDGTVLASGDYEGQVRFSTIDDQIQQRSDAIASLSTQAYPARRVMRPNAGWTTDMKFQPHVSQVFIDGGRFKMLCDVKEGTIIAKIPGLVPDASTPFLPDGTPLLTKNWLNWCYATGIESIPFAGGGLGAIAPNGRWSAHKEWGDKGPCTVSNLITGETIKQPVLEEGAYYSGNMVFSPTAPILVSAVRISGKSHALQVWNYETNEIVGTIRAHERHLGFNDISPDGAILATCSQDETIKLWNMDDLSPIRTLSGHNNNVAEVGFSPDGKTLASAGEDATVRLWHAETGEQRFLLRGDGTPMKHVDFSRDGKTLAALDEEGQLWVWRGDPNREYRWLNSDALSEE